MERDNSKELFGTVVKSVAGRDKKRVFIVVGQRDERLLVTNGELRRADTPKAKNPRHVRPIGHLTEDECQSLRGSVTDGKVREILARYDAALCQTEQD